MKNLLEYVKSRSKDLDDIFIRRLCVDNNEINLVYNEALVDSTMISNFVVRSIVECIREEKILNDIGYGKEDLIDKDKLSDPEYYYDLYLDLVYTDADIEDLKAASDQIEQTTTQLNQFFDIVERMLNFLETNDGYLGYENGQFYFTDLEVSNQFQAYIEKLDELANQMTVEEGKTENDTI